MQESRPGIVRDAVTGKAQIICLCNFESALCSGGYWTTRGYANSRTGRLADWTSRGLVNSRTRQLAYWTSR